MVLDSEVARKIEEIKQDRIHGASWLSRQAIDVLNLAVIKIEAKIASDFLEDLKAVAVELIKARPSMASISNYVSRFIYEVSLEFESDKDLGSLKSFACTKGNELVKDSEEAFLKTVEQGAEIIEKNDRLMTCSYSSTICQALRTARFQGKEFQIVVAESRFGSRVYGEVTAEQLKEYGILAEIIPDNDIGHYISKTNIILAGADSILADGSLINGTPTYAVAQAAKENQIPFYSLCETIKFDVRSYLGQPNKLEEGFDRVPADSITGIITEDGIIKPTDVIKQIEKIEWISDIYTNSTNLLR